MGEVEVVDVVCVCFVFVNSGKKSSEALFCESNVKLGSNTRSWVD